MRKFIIVYEDGNTVAGGGDDDEEVTLTFTMSKKWLEAPVDGVQVVKYQSDEGKWKYWHGVDHYMMLPGGFEIYAHNDLGPYIRKHLEGMVKYGLCISREDYEAYVKKVKDYQWNEVYQKKIKPDRQRRNEEKA